MRDVGGHSDGLGWPIYYRDLLIVGNPDSHIAVCTLWMPKEKIARRLGETQFNCVGNLYSREGINFILRNVLANPAIRYIVLCGKSLNKSDEALLNFVKNGIDFDHRIIGDVGVIDNNIPKKAVDLFRRKVSIVDIRPASSVRAVQSELQKLRKLPPFSKPNIFPVTTAHDVDSFPSEKVGFIVRASNIPEAWFKTIHKVMTFGEIQETDYGIKQRELLDLMVVVDDTRKYSLSLPSWMPLRKRDVSEYVKSFLSVERDPAVAYNYGQRLCAFNGIDQIRAIIKDLKRFRMSRRSVAVLWDPLQDSVSKDPPCVDLIQVAIRHERLFLTVYIRSNDMYRAWHLNAYALRALQSGIAKELPKVTIGPLVTMSQSAHIYEDSWNPANILMAKGPKKILSPKTFIQDPRGSFVIELSEGKIIASLYTSEGTKIANFEGDTADEVKLQVVPFVSRTDHAVYLGKELYRAERALKTGKRFIQEKI